MKAYLRRLPSALGAVLTLATIAFASSGVAAQTAPVSMPGEIIVKVSLDASATDVQQLAEKAKCNVVRAIPYCPNYYLFRLKSVSAGGNKKPEAPTPDVLAGISALKQESKVSVAEPNYIAKLFGVQTPQQTGAKSAVKLAAATPPGSRAKTRATQPPSSVTAVPNDGLYNRQWGMRAIRMPEAWAIQYGATPVVVGVADSGIDRAHPDFNAADGSGSRIVTGRNFYPDDGTNVNAEDYQDPGGHGTHVAGTVAATTNNTVGVAGVAGWNRGRVDVRLKIARVFGSAPTSSWDVIASGIGFLVDENVDVINLSLGGYADVQVLRDVVNRGLARNITIVAAAGNETNDNGLNPSYPNQYPGVISVTAVGPGLTQASYSNFGGQVAVAAPGGDGFGGSEDDIWSTWPTNLPTLGGVTGYDSISGTSMASPHVAGVCALLIAAGAPRNPASIKTILQDSAIPLDETPNPAGGNK